MNNDPHDIRTGRAHDPNLDSIRSAWKELGHAEPPQLLDQAILNTARRHLAGPPQYRRLRWLGAFATAAVLVLALAVVIRQDPQGPAAPIPSGDGFRLEESAAAPREEEDRAIMLDHSSAAPEAIGRTDQDLPAASDSPRAAEPRAKQRVMEARESVSPGLSAEDWIERMLALRAAGRLQELEGELAAFRQAFPDYPLPDELTN